MKKSNRSIPSTVWKVVTFALFAIFSAILLYLFFWTLTASVKTATDFNFYPISLTPKEDDWQFGNYIKVFTGLTISVVKPGVGTHEYSFALMFAYSLLYALGCTVVTILSQAVCGYIFAKYKFPCKKILYSAAMVAMVIPAIGALASELEIMKAIGFYDNIWALMIMKAGFGGMNFLIFYTVFRSIPDDFVEAAELDGASQLRIMMTIMLPMAKATIMIFALNSFIGYWNDFSVNITYLPSTPLAAYAIYYFQNSTTTAIALGGAPWVLCSSIIFCLPVLLLFLIFKNKMLANLNFGGLKE